MRHCSQIGQLGSGSERLRFMPVGMNLAERFNACLRACQFDSGLVPLVVGEGESLAFSRIPKIGFGLSQPAGGCSRKTGVRAGRNFNCNRSVPWSLPSHYVLCVLLA